MPVVNLPWFSDVNKNGEEQLSSEESFIQYNGYIDEKGDAYIRPGIRATVLFSSAIIAAYQKFQSKRFVLLDASNAYLYEENSTDSPGLISSASHSVTFGSGKPIYAIAGNGDVFIATGVQVARIQSDTSVSLITHVNAPTNATHVSWLDNYVLATNGTNTFYWSNLGDPTVWGASNFATAAGKGDVILAHFVVERQIYLIGSNSTEIWENDAVNPFSRVPGGFIEVGCSAQYSVCRVDDSLYWISDRRSLVRIRGRSVEKISTPYDKVFSQLDITDCYADRMDIFGRTFIVFQFPTSQRTIVFEPATSRWMEWGEWDSQLLQWLTFNYKDAFYSPLTGRQYVLTTRWNAISFFKEGVYVDQTPTSSSTTRDAPIKFLRRSGRIDHGSNEKKRCNHISFRVLRGQAQTAMKMFIRWRDNGSSVWSNERTVSLGAVGETQNVRKLFQLGCYENRQWEIAITDAAPFSITNVKEDVDQLS